MCRSQTWLRHVLLAAATVGSLGFGATQALAVSSETAMRTCPVEDYDYYYAPCASGCPGGAGYCAAGGRCRCGQIP